VWHISTSEGGYDFIDTAWKKNMRFTDWYDYDERWRVGYIAKEDTEKLLLSNYTPNDGSVLILVDRSSGTTYDLGHPGILRRIFSYQGSIVTEDVQGVYRTFSLPE